jgi:hypothetical protein
VLLLEILLSVTPGAPTSAPQEFKRARDLQDHDYRRCMGIVERLGLLKFDICKESRNSEFLLALGLFTCIPARSSSPQRVSQKPKRCAKPPFMPPGGTCGHRLAAGKTQSKHEHLEPRASPTDHFAPVCV